MGAPLSMRNSSRDSWGVPKRSLAPVSMFFTTARKSIQCSSSSSACRQPRHAGF